MENQLAREGPRKLERRSYEAPSVTAYGEVRKITAGMSSGASLDETFPSGTPFEDVTFS